MESYGAVQSTGTGVTVPDATLLFKGDFSRSGTDLVLTGPDGDKFVVAGYFETDTPPALLSPQGAMLTGDVVTLLAGPQFPGMYAQAGDGAAQGAKEIGKVQTLEGSATVVRANGVTETLNAGDPVFEGDVVMTGPASKLGLGFVDGTVFSMSADGRMVLNSLIYNPDGSDNSMLFSLVEGSFVFATGQIAPTGDMKIQTPVATMGIRGTTPTVEIVSGVTTGGVNFSILPDPVTGEVGSYTLYSLDGGQPIGTISSVGTKWVLTSANGTITEVEKTQDDLLSDADAVNQINQVYNTYQSNTQNQQNPQAGPENNTPNSSGLNTDPPPGSQSGSGQNTQGGNQQQNTPPDDGNPPANNPPPGPQTNNNPPPLPNGEGDGSTAPTVITGTENPDVLNGTPGADEINALGGDDFIFASQGDDDIDGGAGNDTLFYNQAQQAVVINVVDGTVNSAEFGIDTIANLENFVTGSGNDTITADDKANRIDAGAGEDTIIAGGGDDTIVVSADEADDIDGGEGTDTILFAGDLNIDTRTTLIETENIEVVDLNKTDANILTVSAEDVVNDDPDTILQIRGGAADRVNLTPEFGDNISDLQFSWVKSDETVEDEDGTMFVVYEFYGHDGLEGDGQGSDCEDDEPLAVVHIEQGIDVGILLEGFENGFGPNGWEATINEDGSGPAIVDDNSTEGSSSVLLSTTTGNEVDDPFGDGGPDEGGEGGNDNAERGNVLAIANFLGLRNPEVLDALGNLEGEDNIAVEGSAIKTTFYAKPGQAISFDWFFSTNERPEDNGEGSTEFVNDFAFVVIDGEIFKLFDAVSTGDAQVLTATEGWNRFSIVLDEGDGEDDYDYEHTIAFGVLDNEDPEVETTLNIDHIRLGLGDGQPQTGGEGNDTLIGGDGPNTLIGNGGDDTLIGGRGRDTIRGGEGNDEIRGNRGDDTIFGGRGRDDIRGGRGDDDIRGGRGNDDISGGRGDDIIRGGRGDDIIRGGRGDDTLIGGRGDDILAGGLGENTFVFDGLNDGIDTITDYEEGLDALDLTGLLADALSDDLPAGAELGDIIDQYVQALEGEDGSVTIGVDTNGETGGSDFTEIAVLQDVGTDVDVTVKIGDDQVTVESAALNV